MVDDSEIQHKLRVEGKFSLTIAGFFSIRTQDVGPFLPSTGGDFQVPSLQKRAWVYVICDLPCDSPPPPPDAWDGNKYPKID